MDKFDKYLMSSKEKITVTWINNFYEGEELMDFQKRYIKNNLSYIKIKYPFTYKKFNKYLEKN
tara:strand:+ start:261 stop:449 length:189 start_codon:yes stop_codon:yes gene_type:complete